MSATIKSARTEHRTGSRAENGAENRAGTGGIAASPWQGFTLGRWTDRIDVRGFIQANVTPYLGDAAFLAGPTDRTRALWSRLTAMFPGERARGVYDVDTHTPASITSHAPGFIDREHELIVGLQTDAPLRRAIMPNGGLRMVESGLAAYGYTLDPAVREIFTRYRKTHNDGVFDAYPADVLAARRAHVITGLPDAYGRGRIIGDYRRVPLYGVGRLVAAKQAEKAALDARPSTADVIRDREELAEQIRALTELAEMAGSYGHDVTRPAATAREAIQWLYLAYLAAVKEQNGAAMSLGRTSTFLDIYLERDLHAGLAHRAGGAGARRRLLYQAADRPFPAHPGVRPAVLRGPDLGHRVDRRHRPRRPPAGHPHQLPLPADAVQPRAGARAEPDRAVVPGAAGRVQTVLRAGLRRHQLDPVRVRRPAAGPVG